MKHTKDLAYLRQLCCLGLGQEVVIPEFLKAVKMLIPSNNNVYTPVNEFGFPIGAITEFYMPEIIEISKDVLPKFFTLDVMTKIDQNLKDRSVITNPNVFFDNFFHTDLYNLIWRPSGQYHMMLGLVSDKNGLVGRLFLFRPPSSRAFSRVETQSFIKLLPYIAYAAQERPDSSMAFTENGESCMVIADSKGEVVYLSNQAKKILTLATEPNYFRFDKLKRLTLPPALIKLCRNLNSIFTGKDASPPGLTITNSTGKFNFRAYWLDKLNCEPDSLIGITIEYQEPLQLKIIRGLQLMPLSPVQKEVASLIAQGSTNEAIGQRLHIKKTTVKDHLDKIFIKLDINRREELLPKLMAIEKTSLLLEPNQSLH
jgi:DNA-binding CsgD family transcriptional regulator